MSSSSPMATRPARPSSAIDSRVGAGAGDRPPIRRLGILVPSSNSVVEPAMIRLLSPLDDRLTVHVSRVSVTEIEAHPRSDRQFAVGPMVAATRLLADARVNATLWAGTSGAWVGIGADRRLVDAIGEATGLPATTATLALLDAFEVLDVRTYAWVVPYVEAITAAIVETLGAVGFDCLASDEDGLTENWAFATVTAESIASRLRLLATARPDATVIHCTNLRGAEVAWVVLGRRHQFRAPRSGGRRSGHRQRDWRIPRSSSRAARSISGRRVRRQSPPSFAMRDHHSKRDAERSARIRKVVAWRPE
jgi:maleate isomerase